MENKSNIIFYFLSTKKNTGRGGAYYSLLAQKEQLKSLYNTFLIHNSKLNHSTVLDSDTSLFLKGFFLIDFWKIFFFFIKIKPKVFLSYDQTEVYLRILCRIFKCKYFFIKAGGPNMKMVQHFSNVIFFSKENYEHSHHIRCENGYLISNRIHPAYYNHSRLGTLNVLNGYEEYIKILRISRISNVYKEVFIVTINNHLELQKKGIQVLTHIIGFPEDLKLVEELKIKIENISHILLITEDEFTINACELIPLYDIVIGIGRGFWEGVSYGKFVLGYTKSSSLPVLVNNQNIEEFKKFNCSPRINLSKFENFADNLEVYLEPIKRKEYINLQYLEFKSNYSSETLGQKFKLIFKESLHESIDLIAKSIILVLYRNSRIKAKYFKDQISNFLFFK
ncbi:MAG: hypothetical protein ACK4ND_17210 [Cytophagaceae bacterium]